MLKSRNVYMHTWCNQWPSNATSLICTTAPKKEALVVIKECSTSTPVTMSLLAIGAYLFVTLTINTLEEDHSWHGASHCIAVVTDCCCVSLLRQLEDRRQLRSSDDSHMVSTRAGRGNRLQWGGSEGRGMRARVCMKRERKREIEGERGREICFVVRQPHCGLYFWLPVKSCLVLHSECVRAWVQASVCVCVWV